MADVMAVRAHDNALVTVHGPQPAAGPGNCLGPKVTRAGPTAGPTAAGRPSTALRTVACWKMECEGLGTGPASP